MENLFGLLIAMAMIGGFGYFMYTRITREKPTPPPSEPRELPTVTRLDPPDETRD